MVVLFCFVFPTSPVCPSLSGPSGENLAPEIGGSRVSLGRQREEAEEEMAFQHSEPNSAIGRKKENK